MNQEELKYLLALSKVKGVGPVYAKKLLDEVGEAALLFDQKTMRGSSSKLSLKLLQKVWAFDDWAEVENEIACIGKYKAKVHTYGGINYPNRLAFCEDSPLLFFSHGKIAVNPSRVVSIVGTRASTAYGLDCCRRVVEELANYKVCVVSGLAYGIDACAHKAALNCGLSTVGVMATGLDIIYPRAHTSLVEEMKANGGIITEYGFGSRPKREHFPMRNRIIAGLSDVVVVIQSRLKGGALITARAANSYQRDVAAVPGRVADEASKGCNLLIREQKAQLVESGENIAEMMGWKKTVPARQEAISTFEGESSMERLVLKILENQHRVHLDKLSIELAVHVAELAPILLQMELQGLLKKTSGCFYERN